MVRACFTYAKLPCFDKRCCHRSAIHVVYTYYFSLFLFISRNVFCHNARELHLAPASGEPDEALMLMKRKTGESLVLRNIMRTVNPLYVRMIPVYRCTTYHVCVFLYPKLIKACMCSVRGFARTAHPERPREPTLSISFEPLVSLSLALSLSLSLYLSLLHTHTHAHFTVSSHLLRRILYRLSLTDTYNHLSCMNLYVGFAPSLFPRSLDSVQFKLCPCHRKPH